MNQESLPFNLRCMILALRTIVEEQANSPALQNEAATKAEAELQNELRRINRAVEIFYTKTIEYLTEAK